MVVVFNNIENNLLCINGAFLYSGNIDLIKEQIFTIFHELKHARQSLLWNVKRLWISED